MGYVKIELDLPDYIAEWFEEYCKKKMIDKSQFIEKILMPYYEAYIFGRAHAKLEIKRGGKYGF